MNNKPTFHSIVKKPLHFCAFGFGSGLLTPSPGTWGTLLACLLYLPLAFLFTHPVINFIFLVIVFVFGCVICDQTSRELGVHDFAGIVWDEFVGVWLVLLYLPETMLAHYGLYACTLIAFVLFRIFDIVKPPPIKQIDRYAKGGFGIMIDDVVAGIFVLVLLYIYSFIFIQ